MAHHRTMLDVFLVIFLPTIVQVLATNPTCSSGSPECAAEESNRVADLSGLLQIKAQSSPDSDQIKDSKFSDEGFTEDDEELLGEDVTEGEDGLRIISGGGADKPCGRQCFIDAGLVARRKQCVKESRPDDFKKIIRARRACIRSGKTLKECRKQSGWDVVRTKIETCMLPFKTPEFEACKEQCAESSLLEEDDVIDDDEELLGEDVIEGEDELRIISGGGADKPCGRQCFIDAGLVARRKQCVKESRPDDFKKIIRARRACIRSGKTLKECRKQSGWDVVRTKIETCMAPFKTPEFEACKEQCAELSLLEEDDVIDDDEELLGEDIIEDKAKSN